MCDQPQMRGLFITQAKRTVVEAVTLSAIGGFLFREYYIKPRRKRIRDYYKDFDPEASLEYMIKKGHMQSAENPLTEGTFDDDNENDK